MFIKLKSLMINLYKNSLIGALCEKISVWYTKSVETGIITNFFTAYDSSDNKYDAVTGWLFKVIGVVLKPFGFIKNMTHNSSFVGFFEDFCNNFLNISLRAFSLFLLPWGVIGVFWSVVDYPGAVVMAFYVFLCLLSAFGILYNKNIANMVNNSFLCRLAGVKPLNEESFGYNPHVYIFSGVIVGVISVLTGLLPVLALLFLVICGVVALYSTYTVTLLFAAMLPFLPTMVMVAGSLALVMCIIVKYITGKYSFKIKGSVLNLYVIFMCIVYVIGTVFSVNVTSSLKISLVYIAFMLSYFVISKVVDSTKKLVLFISSMGIASIPVGIYGVYQKLTGFDNENTWLDSEMFEEIKGRVVSFFDNPNVFGEYIILLFMFCLALVFISKKYSLKAVYVVALAVLGASMIFTYSRGCWIGLVIAVCVFLFFVNKKLLGIAAIAGVISIFFLPESIISRILSVGNLADSSTSYRVFIWNGTVEMLKDFWLTGIGVGSDAFNAVYPRYAYSAITAPHPHNLYLLVFAETGIIGIIVLVTVVLTLFNKLLHVIKYTQNKELKVIAAATGSAVTGFLVQGMFDNVWYNYRVFLLFWIFVAIGASVYNVYRKEKCDD